MVNELNVCLFENFASRTRLVMDWPKSRNHTISLLVDKFRSKENMRLTF